MTDILFTLIGAGRAHASSHDGKKLVEYYLKRKHGITSPVFLSRPRGKPYIEGAPCFNVSHSKRLVCAAFSDSEVGIDVEYVRDVNIAGISRRFSSAERDFIEKSADPKAAFFYVWTRKEAFLKARGSGFFCDTSLFDCTQNFVSENSGAVPRAWYITSFNIREGYAAAFCAAQQAAENFTLREVRASDIISVYAG
ncbi:MAG: 4'-phosphopantetheinyl transferase superfamily protein [Spirochaetaceae bacterium]|jgi:phosphopantetheinyl transferase|nr:4'-phosphopantetheinyl transferase superfamily protein [Spirochaetaceae bacterium]